MLASSIAPAPAFTWRDLATWETYGPHLDGVEADRATLPAALRALAQEETVGGFLLHDDTADTEGGTFVMLAGQTAQQQRQTLDNAGWGTSCGLVYSRSRTGEPYVAPRATLTSDGHEWSAWPLSNSHAA